MGDISAIEKKLATLGLEQTPEEFVGSLPAPVKARVEALQVLQKHRNELESTFRKERAELEEKYEALYGPLYKERADMVSGAKAVGEDVAGIPEFWITVLLKCDITAEMMKDKDLEVLNYLTDIKSENTCDEENRPNGFKLFFHFSANPFFSQSVLEKTYIMLADDDGVLERAEGTKIQWLAGKDVTVKIMKKKPKGKGKADAKPQIKTEKVESFFNFFSPPEVPGEDDEVDDEAMEELQAVIEADYEVGATIREKIIPRAVDWYTGEAVDDEPYYMGDEDEFDEDDEDDEDDDEDDDDDDDAPAPKGKGKKGAAPAGQQPPECKQQ